METFADSPGVPVTFLSAGPQLEVVVLLQTEQAVSVDVDHLEDVWQHLPVARLENYSRMSSHDVQMCLDFLKLKGFNKIVLGSRQFKHKSMS